ncbi:DUF4381 domain-containing protein [Gilvimarinus xylanilyticus]|uniref:DUF4381 domain-containing protein n=1 Tax=Gilvimarinus xylanilyticus TaxID=2944139 RepID=A0A9X2KTE7_9GAMM|nr:DUF4381 domain-containing protein [Gilvimarinus xylanilyticus]
MNPSDPLAQLKDIHSPEAIGWWPLAPLWWVIIAIALLAVVALAFALHRLYRANQYRRDALAELRQMPDDKNNQDFARRINTLLKRTAVACYGFERCATLHGQAWVDFLQTSAPRINSANAHVLADAPYHPAPELDQQALRDYAARWIKQHRKNLREANNV